MDRYLLCEDSASVKRPILKSTEFVITPLTGNEMQKLIDHETDDAKKALYMNLADRAKKDPENALFYTYWDVSLKNEEKDSVGGLYFDGPHERGSLLINYEPIQRFTEDKIFGLALRRLCDWAFTYEDVYAVHGYCDGTDFTKIRDFERATMIFRGSDKGVEHYSVEKERSSWTGIYLIVGVLVGFIFGFVFQSMAMAMVVGVISGVLVGGSLDFKASKAREAVTGENLRATRYRKKQAPAHEIKIDREAPINQDIIEAENEEN